jgi:hypothetical protein
MKASRWQGKLAVFACAMLASFGFGAWGPVASLVEWHKLRVEAAMLDRATDWVLERTDAETAVRVVRARIDASEACGPNGSCGERPLVVLLTWASALYRELGDPQQEGAMRERAVLECQKHLSAEACQRRIDDMVDGCRRKGKAR